MNDRELIDRLIDEMALQRALLRMRLQKPLVSGGLSGRLWLVARAASKLLRHRRFLNLLIALAFWGGRRAFWSRK